jgi:hypothetical protein
MIQSDPLFKRMPILISIDKESTMRILQVGAVISFLLLAVSIIPAQADIVSLSLLEQPDFELGVLYDFDLDCVFGELTQVAVTLRGTCQEILYTCNDPPGGYYTVPADIWVQLALANGSGVYLEEIEFYGACGEDPIPFDETVFFTISDPVEWASFLEGIGSIWVAKAVVPPEGMCFYAGGSGYQLSEIILYLAGDGSIPTTPASWGAIKSTYR